MKSVAFVLLAGLCVAACNSVGGRGGDANLATPDAFAPPAANKADLTDRADYRIQPDDQIEVSVFQLPDFSRTVQVDTKGQIKLPLIGLLKADGRSVRELEDDIAAKLKAKYLQDPQVLVSIKDAIGQRVTVQGAVRSSGVYQARGQTTLMQVIAQAGGFSDVADENSVFVFRQTEQGRMGARFDAEAIKYGKADDPQIYGGDMVVVDTGAGITAWRRFRDFLTTPGLFMLI